MRLIIISIFVFASMSCFQTKHISKNGGYSSGDKFIDSLFEHSIYLIMSNSTGVWNTSGGKHFLLLQINNQWKKISFERKGHSIPGAPLPFDYKEDIMEKEEAEHLYELLKNDLLKIQLLNKGCDEVEVNKNGKNLSCETRDAETNHFYIKNKSTITTISYYDVYAQNACCPGNDNRLTFIRSNDLLRKLFLK